MSYWGSNPFTNYQTTPYSGSFNGQQGWGSWGSSGSGQFNPEAMNFGQGGYGSTPPWMGGQASQGAQGGYGQMPPWMQSAYGGMIGGMGGQMPSWMNTQSRQTMPAGFSTDPTANNYGGNVAQNTFGAGAPTPATGQTGGQATPAQAASSPYGMFANVVHNGVADSGGQNAVPAIMAKILYGSTPPGGNNNMSYNPMTGQWS